MKTTVYLVIYACVLLKCSYTYSQNFILYGDRTFGGDGRDVTPGIIYDGYNIILSGESTTDTSADKTDPLCVINFYDTWTLKIDTAFNILWNSDLGGNNNDEHVFLMNNQNNIIICAESVSDSSCAKSDSSRGGFGDYWICMMDSNGNKLWDKTYGTNRSQKKPQIIRLPSGDYIVCGTSDARINGDKTSDNWDTDNVNPFTNDYWIIKLDSMGNKLWDKDYGGTGDEAYAVAYNSRYAFSLLNDDGTDFILAGTTMSPQSGNISDTARGQWDVWIIKLDSAGNKIWDKRYGGSNGDVCSRIIHTADNGYIVCGSTISPQGLDVSDTSRGFEDVWVIKLDSIGNKQWDRRYGGNKDDIGEWIENAPGGGYWISGYTSSDSSGEVSEPNYSTGLLPYDYWMLKIDSAGNKIWDKRFGAGGTDRSPSFIIMPDSSIYLCGTADQGVSAVKTDFGKGLQDYWVVHFKYTDNTTNIQQNTNENNLVTIYPNPAKDIIYINTKNNFKPVEINLYDAAGRKVMGKKTKGAASFSIKELNAGIYFYEVKDAKGNAGRGKVVKE